MALPVSSSTVIVGAISGVGFYNTKKETNIQRKMNLNVMNNNDIDVQNSHERMNCVRKIIFRLKKMNIKILLKIVGVWIITIPVNALICALIYIIIYSVAE